MKQKLPKLPAFYWNVRECEEDEEGQGAQTVLYMYTLLNIYQDIYRELEHGQNKHGMPRGLMIFFHGCGKLNCCLFGTILNKIICGLGKAFVGPAHSYVCADSAETRQSEKRSEMRIK